MAFKIKGTITEICKIRTTKNGTAIQQIFFKRSDTGDYLYPCAIGNDIDVLLGYEAGDNVELDFELKGSQERFNNMTIIAVRQL